MDKTVIVIALVSLLAVFFAVKLYDYKRRKRHDIFLQQLRERWNGLVKDDVNAECLQYVRKEFQCKEYFSIIDDITWNDLEMDGVYSVLNMTQSSIGEVYLYEMLRVPEYDKGVLEERNKLIEMFTENQELREKYQCKFSGIGKQYISSFTECMNCIQEFELPARLPHALAVGLLIGSCVLCSVNVKMGVCAVIIAFILNFMIYAKARICISKYIPTIVQIDNMLQAITGDKYISDDNKTLQGYLEVFKTASKIQKKYEKYTQAIQLTGRAGAEADVIMMYVRFLTHIDIFNIHKIKKVISLNSEIICKAYETVGMFDALIAVANFRHILLVNGMCFCLPKFTDRKIYNIEGAYNPLLEKSVQNSIDVGGSVLITGSNATGKSTFLRTVAINAVLAQTIYTVCATNYKAAFFKVITSMSIRDNIFSHDSYYMMEIKAIKRILDCANDETPILCCLDEILRGTNTVERIAAATEILQNFATSNVICFAASHDVELTKILKKYYKNYHFKELVNDEGIAFDYTLYEGQATSRNAIELLRFLGYAENIIVEAKKRVDEYMSTGEWNIRI